jgi:D-3-phosphoglycerate dehydrogenase
MTGGQPHLVYERWASPIVQTLLADAPITLARLDLAHDPAGSWAALAGAHGYQVANRTDVAGLPNGEQWLVGPELLARCPQLLAVCSTGAGYDVIDVEACTQAGVAVCNNSGPGAESVAEHALGLMLDLAKKITLSDRVLRRGALSDREVLRGGQLLGKTLGVVGMGAIGRRLVELCAPFRMTVLAFDPYVATNQPVPGVEFVSLEQLVQRADFVQLCCPLTAETEGLIGAAQFDAMKDTAVLITTARGRVHDEAALYDALLNGWIAGAGLDVFHDEPPRADNPLLSLDNVVATPHTAGITVEAGHDLATATASQWRLIFDGRVPPRLINPDVWPRYCERFEDLLGFRPSVGAEHQPVAD